MKLSIFILFLLLTGIPLWAQQAPDPEFDTSVENPAYKKEGPRVLFDEAHHNFHTIEGRYKPFVDLMMNDGYRVIRNRQPFNKSMLSSFKILVISNALEPKKMTTMARTIPPLPTKKFRPYTIG